MSKGTDTSKGSVKGNRSAIIYYNCQKLGHLARNCLEPLTKKRKQYLMNLRKVLEVVKATKAKVESSGKDNI